MFSGDRERVRWEQMVKKSWTRFFYKQPVYNQLALKSKSVRQLSELDHFATVKN